MPLPPPDNVDIIVTPDWNEVPKETIHLKEGYSFSRYEIVNMPDTMFMLRGLLIGRTGNIPVGQERTFSSLENPLTVKFPSIAEDAAGNDIDIYVDALITLTGTQNGKRPNHLPLLASFQEPGSVSLTSYFYDPDTDKTGWTDKTIPYSDLNASVADFVVKFRMMRNGEQLLPEDGYLLSSIDDMDTFDGNVPESCVLMEKYGNEIYTKLPLEEQSKIYDISPDGRTWAGKLLYPASLTDNPGFLMKWVSGTTINLKQPYTTTTHLFSAFAPYSIIATAHEGGEITSPGKTYVWWRNDRNYEIRADAGYKISRILVDGSEVEITDNTMMSVLFEDVKEDHTIEAFFERRLVTISYDPNAPDANGDMSGESRTDFSGAVSPVAPSAYEREFYTFICWNTQPDGSGENYAPGEQIPMGDDDIILFAQWKPVTHTVRFFDTMASNEIVSKQEVPHASSATIPDVPQYEGYRFDESSFTFADVENIVADMDIYLRYIPNEYEVTVNYLQGSYTDEGNENRKVLRAPVNTSVTFREEAHFDASSPNIDVYPELPSIEVLDDEGNIVTSADIRLDVDDNGSPVIIISEMPAHNLTINLVYAPWISMPETGKPGEILLIVIAFIVVAFALGRFALLAINDD